MFSGEWWHSSDGELCDAIVSLEARMRRDYAALLGVLSEAESRGLAKSQGYSKLSYLLQDLVRVSAAEARRRVEQAVAVTPARMVSGESVAASLPVTGEAARAGEIGAEHIRVIDRHVSALPGWVSGEQRASVEQVLVEQARLSPPRAVDDRGRELRTRIDQDGDPPADEQWVQPRNELQYRVRTNGRMTGNFDLEAEAGALFQSVLSPMAKPEPLVEGLPDDRTTAERLGDGFADLIRLAAVADDVPSEGGAKPHIAVTVPLEVLEQRVGTALLEGAGYISAGQARYLACDAKVFPVVLGGRSVPVDVAVARYTVPTGMRRALVNRDRGCSFPSCSRPASVCHSHHVVAWPEGPTRLSNLALLCPRHHRLIHGSEWEVAIVDGRPEFRPPRFLDPDQTPRRNEIHYRLQRE